MQHVMGKLLSTVSLLFIAVLAQAEAQLTPDEILAKVKANGAGQVVREVWQSHAKVQVLLRGVGSGDVAWLEAAKAIQPATDAGSAEELADALAEALINNPYAVLPWLRRLWWADAQSVCLFAYDSELPGGIAAYIVRLETALGKRPPSQSKALRKNCLRGIQQTKIALAAARAMSIWSLVIRRHS